MFKIKENLVSEFNLKANTVIDTPQEQGDLGYAFYLWMLKETDWNGKDKILIIQ